MRVIAEDEKEPDTSSGIRLRSYRSQRATVNSSTTGRVDLCAASNSPAEMKPAALVSILSKAASAAALASGRVTWPSLLTSALFIWPGGLSLLLHQCFFSGL